MPFFLDKLPSNKTRYFSNTCSVGMSHKISHEKSRSSSMSDDKDKNDPPPTGNTGTRSGGGGTIKK